MGDSADLFDFLDEAQSPTVRKREWMNDKEFILVTPENIAECIDACISSGLYALDLETTGLDNRLEPNGHTRDKIAGVCISPDGVRGYYIPLHHVEVRADESRVPRECNVPWTVFEREFRKLMEATDKGETKAIFHHGKFDQEFLQFPGGEPFLEWDKASCWEDTMLLAYLADSRRRNKQLKYLTDKELGFDQVELKELFPDDYKGRFDFSVLDPTDQAVLWYGGGDGIFTFLLYHHFIGSVMDAASDGRTQKAIYVIEKSAVAAIRWMERCRLHVDMDKVRELVRLGQDEWFESIMEVYQEASKILGRDIMPGLYKVLKESFVGDNFDYLLPQQLDDAKAKAKSTHPDPLSQVETDGKKWPAIYDVNSPQQLGKMFDEMGVPGLKRTEKSGQVQTSKAELDRIVDVAGQKFPFMSKIKRFREVNKALSSYLFPMLLDVDPSDDTMRINFRQDGTDTGRFSTPAKDAARGKLIGFPQVNLQSIPSTYNPKRPACMNRLRECITPRSPDAYIVAIDFAGEELRLITNLSREPKWMAEFFHCAGCNRTFENERREGIAPPPRCPNCGSDKIGDLHTLTGIELYGENAPEKPEWKALRGNAKGTNFALSYGGGGSAVSRSTGVDKQEGWRIKRQFDRTYGGLRLWWGHQHDFGRTHGFVRTAFGRKYPVPDITSADGGFRSKAERNAVNGPIQGTGADMMKIAMVFVYKEMKERGWLDKCKLIATMHDELVFEIDGDILAEAIEVIVPIMTSNKFITNMNWPIPFTCDVEMGHDWTVAWDLNAMRFKEVRFVENKKFYKAEDLPEGHDWDSLPSWPADLMPLFPEARGVVSGQGSPPSGSTPAPPSSTPESQSDEPPPTPGAVGAQAAPEVEVGGDFTYQLSAPLTTDTMFKMAEVLHKCRNGGTRKLHLKSRDGASLDGWMQEFGVDEFLVNHQQFYFLAQERDL